MAFRNAKVKVRVEVKGVKCIVAVRIGFMSMLCGRFKYGEWRSVGKYGQWGRGAFVHHVRDRGNEEVSWCQNAIANASQKSMIKEVKKKTLCRPSTRMHELDRYRSRYKT